MSAVSHRLSIANIEHAATVIDPVFLHSPQYVHESLSDVVGVPLMLKVETVNPIRSFKGRGATYFVSTVADDARLLCASAGNFGQAIAYACRQRGLPLRIYASVNANPYKVERMRALGADVVLQGEDFDGAKLAARAEAALTGAWMVEDGFEPAVSEGAGTIGRELLQAPTPPDVVVIPLGNGALLAGVARIMKARAPATRIIAVQAHGAPAMVESWRSGQLVRYARISTIADGIGVREPIPAALGDLAGLIDDAVLVTDEQIIAAMRLLHQHAGLVVEPSGAVGLAAMLQAPGLVAGNPTAAIICGGNLTDEQRRSWLGD